MLKDVRPAVVLLFSLSIVTGLLYPALITGIAQSVFPAQANGSLLESGGKVVGSSLIGQNFSGSHYFWGRPSATAPTPYNAAASGGSNLGPLNPALEAAVKARLATLKASNPEQQAPIPVDLVTTSASGLDPHISVAAALWQVPRIAHERHMRQDKLNELVASHTEGRQWGILGEPRVNVLLLNLALDKEGSP
jgi:K+-transporting ATPase ATPase C chain